ncbi:hypothetical protein SKAU_G00124650 [Synaphobranchus kaupii]|uniref:Uncharacterized protein n=1 Tax=Synaphobranchus kaupii TaxID=118154 RepID=A0A9Q1J1S5_SYNKA|nr:hypothetical protein SKAU_G00124650 [Synaphobranchus kaupii]
MMAQKILSHYVAADQALTQAATKETMVGIFIIKGNNVSDEQEDIRIVFMGLTVLLDLDNVAFAAAILIGLIAPGTVTEELGGCFGRTGTTGG